MFLLVATNIFGKQSLRGVPWSKLKSENNEKLYTSGVYWKNQSKFTIRKHALLWNKHEYIIILLILLLKIPLLTHSLALVSFCNPWNTSENEMFPVFRWHRKKPVAWNGLQVSVSLSFRNSHQFLFCKIILWWTYTFS